MQTQKNTTIHPPAIFPQCVLTRDVVHALHGDYVQEAAVPAGGRVGEDCERVYVRSSKCGGGT